MVVRKIFFLLVAIQSFCEASLFEEFKSAGYVQICDEGHANFELLYACFDEMIAFLQVNPAWEHKLFAAKERFIRSKDKNLYSTDFFGLYDESKRKGRDQISFYYSVHFHDFIASKYPELMNVMEIRRFLDACLEIQRPYGSIFENAGAEFGLGELHLLLKIVKYHPAYAPTRPHYDGTAFSLFLDSTDNESLFLSPYKNTFTVNDFFSPIRENNSILLIPGTFLSEFSINPTPHIVLQSQKTRYAAVAFAMRPNFTPQKIVYSPLPNFNR